MKDKTTITIEYLSTILKFISMLTDNKSKKVKKVDVIIPVFVIVYNLNKNAYIVKAMEYTNNSK